MTKHIRSSLIDATLPSIPALPDVMERAGAHGASPLFDQIRPGFGLGG